MKKHIFSTLIIVFAAGLFSCSTYTITKTVDADNHFSKMKRFGIIVRTTPVSRVTHDEFNANIAHWLGGYKKLKQIEILTGLPDSLTVFGEDEDRFYQSANKRFLKFKAIGVTNSYISANGAALKKLMAEKKLDGIIIYEVFPIISTEMEFMRFNSVVLVIGNDLNIHYFDYQDNRFEGNGFFFSEVKPQLLDKTSGRLIKTLTDLNCVEEP